MPNGKVGYIDLMRSATLTPSSEALTFPVENVLNLSKASKWRTIDISSESILIDHGSAKAISGIFIDGSNIVSGDTTFTFSAGTTTACSDESQALTKDTKSYSELPSWVSKTYRYNKLTITKASGSYIEIGKVFVFQTLYEFIKNWVIGYREELNLNINEAANIYGHEMIDFLSSGEGRRLPFVGIDDTQKELFYETLMVEDVINQGVIFYDNVRSEAFFGKFRAGDATHVFLNNWNCDLFFSEFI